jgi:hypothetical protein
MTTQAKKRDFSFRYSLSLVKQISEFLTQSVMDSQF